MKISELKGDPGAKQSKKRVGRGEGSGLGKTSGRGNKGQQSRKSGNVSPYFEGGQMPLSRRVPKRGFTSPFKKQYEIVNLSILEEKFNNGEEVNSEILREKGLVKAKDFLLKVLGEGTLSKKLTIKANAFSQSAIEKITQVGGTYEVV